MKRPIILGLTTLALIGLVGCSPSNNTKVESDTNQNTQIESSSEQTSNKENKNKVNKTENSISYLGKVSNIVGNQVTVKLIDGAFELTEEMKSAMNIFEFTEEQQKQLERGEIVRFPNGDFAMKAVEAKEGELDNDPGFSIEDLEAQGIDVAAEEASERAKKQSIVNKMEFNGESKDFTLQAGVEIHNELVGYDAKLSDIKKGSIIEITTDDKNNIVKVSIKF